MALKYVVATAMAVALAAPAIAAAQVEITAKAMTEKRSTAKDGTTQVALVPAARIVPGDTIVYQLSYHNAGTQPVKDFVLNNPLPAQLAYRAPASGSPAPELSVDGTTFGPLAALRVAASNGASRAATVSDVKVVRWRLAQPVAAGARGQVSFLAVLK